MKKRSKRRTGSEVRPENDPFLLRIGEGERLYKLFYFRPTAAMLCHFESHFDKGKEEWGGEQIEFLKQQDRVDATYLM